MSQTDGTLYFSTLTAIYKKPRGWYDLTELVAGESQASGSVDGALTSARFAGLEVHFYADKLPNTHTAKHCNCSQSNNVSIVTICDLKSFIAHCIYSEILCIYFVQGTIEALYKKL